MSKFITGEQFNVGVKQVATQLNTKMELLPGKTIVKEISNPLTTSDMSEESPVGNIISVISTVAPTHYLICDGSEYNISDYPYLVNHFKEKLGSINYFGGDGVTTFAVPKKTDYNTEPNTTWICSDEFLFRDSGIFSVLNGRQYFKVNEGDAIVANVLGTDNTTVAILVSTNPNCVESYSLFDSSLVNTHQTTVEYLGLTWYICEAPYAFLFDASSTGFAQKISSAVSHEDRKTYGLDILKASKVSLKHSFECIKYEPIHFAVNQYGGFETEVLFDGSANEVGEYGLADSVDNYNFVLIQSIDKIGAEIPIKMTSNTTPAPYSVSASSNHPTTSLDLAPWKAFNGTCINEMDCWSTDNVNSAYLQIYLGTPQVCNSISVRSRNEPVTSPYFYPPESIEILGSNDGVIWKSIHTHKFSTWTQAEKKSVTFYNGEAYSYYRFNFTKSSTWICVSQVQLFDTDSSCDFVTDTKLLTKNTGGIISDDYSMTVSKDVLSIITVTKGINRITGIKGQLPSLLCGGEF